MRKFCVQHQVKIDELIAATKRKNPKLYSDYLMAKRKEMEVIINIIESEVDTNPFIINKEISKLASLKQKVYNRIYAINKELLVLEPLQKTSFINKLKKLFK